MLQSLGITGYTPARVYTVTGKSDYSEHVVIIVISSKTELITPLGTILLCLYNGESFQYFELRAQLM